MDNGNQAMVHEQQEPIEAQDVAANAAEGLSEEEAAIVGFFRNCHGASRPACSATSSRFKSINHVLRETYRPLQWRTATKEYTGSLANRQKVTAQLALVAQISLLLEANGTDATRKPWAITTKQDEDYQNNLDDAVGHMFFRMDEQLREDDEWRALANPCHRFSFNLLKCLKAPACVKGTPYSEGSTASVALISGNRIIVGSAGDSRCVLSRNGQAMDECRRIQIAGGQVTWDRVHFRCATRFQLGSYGVNGDLAMSRSIGDFHFKSNCLPATEQIVTCNPDVCTVVITDDTEFLLIASDGIWDMFSSQGAVNFVHQKLASGTTGLHTICDGLLDHCIKSRDNMTVILVQFKPAARIPLPAPATVMPAAQPSASETSSGTSSVIKEDPPASVNNA